MKNRNNEIEIAPEMEFDYDEFDEEQKNIPVEVHENPYDDYDVWDVEITELSQRKSQSSQGQQNQHRNTQKNYWTKLT